MKYVICIGIKYPIIKWFCCTKCQRIGLHGIKTQHKGDVESACVLSNFGSSSEKSNDTLYSNSYIRIKATFTIIVLSVQFLETQS